MIVVKVELHPGGRESEAVRLGTAYITKDGSVSTTVLADYDFRVEGKRAGGTVGRDALGTRTHGRDGAGRRDRNTGLGTCLDAIGEILGRREVADVDRHRAGDTDDKDGFGTCARG